jgi:hypothetical protein
MTVFLTSDRTLRAVAYANGVQISQQQINQLQQFGLRDDCFPDPLPPYLEALDKAGFVFDFEPLEEGTAWVWEHPEKGRAPDGKDLLSTVKNAYWHHVGFHKEVAELGRRGFTVEPFAELFSGCTPHYWRYNQANRVSPLFPTEEMAWRDAWRQHEKVVAKIQDEMAMRQTTVHRMTEAGLRFDMGKAQSAFAAIRAMEPLLEEAGYEITDTHWRRRNYRLDVPGGREAVIRDAVKTWAGQNLHQFMKAINDLNTVSAPAQYGTVHMLDMLQRAGYIVTSGGWNHAKADKIQLGKDLDWAVYDAWLHYIGPNSYDSPTKSPSTAAESWAGLGLPPMGVKVWVTPHNVVWGFNTVEPQLMTVRGYHAEYVWLQRDKGPGAIDVMFVTTRTDKVTFSTEDPRHG